MRRKGCEMEATNNRYVASLLDTSGIEPDPSRTLSSVAVRPMLSERDNQLHHVPCSVDKHLPLIWLFTISEY